MTSTDMPARFEQPAETVARRKPRSSDWAETALTLLFAAAAVLFVFVSSRS